MVVVDTVAAGGRYRALPGRRRSRRVGAVVAQIGVVAAFVVVWQVFALSETAAQADMPGPFPTVQRLGELLVTGEYWAALGATVLNWTVALIICIVVGIPVGLAIGRSRRATDSSKLTVDFLRTIPPLALIPLLLLLFGPSPTMVISASVLAGIWPLIIQSMYAAQQADPVLRQVARSFRLNRRDRILFVLAPDALAFIWPGLRLAVVATLLVTVSAELIGGARGVGQEILNAQLFNLPETLFAYVLTACFLGLLINALLLWGQRRLLWWHPSMRDGKNS